MMTGRKNLKFYRGVLESAGLGEVAFYLKKAKQDLLFAMMSLDGTDFSSFDELPAIQAKIVRLREFVAEVGEDIEQYEKVLVSKVADKDDEEGEES